MLTRATDAHLEGGNPGASHNGHFIVIQFFNVFEQKGFTLLGIDARERVIDGVAKGDLPLRSSNRCLWRRVVQLD
jgi:hypothetical protein